MEDIFNLIVFIVLFFAEDVKKEEEILLQTTRF